MTVSDDFIPVEGQEEFETGPSYPVAFGIELNPRVQGIALGIVGLVGAYFLFSRLVQPVQEQVDSLESEIVELEAQIEQQEGNLAEIESVRAELNRAIEQRVGIYSLLGTPESLDTLLLDINQQIEVSNASIEQVIAGDFDQRGNSATLASLGLTSEQVDRVRSRFANDPVIQKLLYTSKLLTFNPSGGSGLVTDGTYGQELNGKLERQIVNVRFQALFSQTQTILRNLERLEPLLIIRDFNQSIAQPPGNLSEEDVQGLSRLLETDFTLEVLVPVGDPTEVPPPPAPEQPAEGEGEQGGDAEGGNAEDGG